MRLHRQPLGESIAPRRATERATWLLRKALGPLPLFGAALVLLVAGGIWAVAACEDPSWAPFFALHGLSAAAIVGASCDPNFGGL